MPAVSVIITTYNVEHYLEQCLTSVQGQTLADIEIIVVDDGSSDATPSIIARFAESDDRIRPVLLESNSPGGVATPANVGLNRATGEYVGFVDGDDFVEPTMFEKLLGAALRYDADLAMCKYLLLDVTTNSLGDPPDARRWSSLEEPVYELDRDARKRFLPFVAVPWRKLYRRRMLDEHTIRFPEGDYFYEDNPFHWFTILTASSIALVPEVLCYHRVSRAGQTTDVKDPRLLQMFDHHSTIQAWVDDHGLDADFSAYVLGWTISQAMWIGERTPPELRRDLFARLTAIVDGYDTAVVQAMFRQVHRTPYSRAVTRAIITHNYPAFVRILERGLDTTPAVNALYQLRYSDVRTTARLTRAYAAAKTRQWRTRRARPAVSQDVVTSTDVFFALTLLDRKLQRLSESVAELRASQGLASGQRVPVTAASTRHGARAPRVPLLVIASEWRGLDALERHTLSSSTAARVLVASAQPLPDIPEGVAAEDVHVLPVAAQSHGPAFRRVLHAAAQNEKLDVYLRNDAWLHAWLPHVKVVVGLDKTAAAAARQLSQEGVGLAFADSLIEALELTELIDREGLDAPPSDVTAASGRRHLAEVADPEIPAETLRAARQAVGAAIEALSRGEEARAAEIARSAAASVGDERLRADILGDVASWALSNGRTTMLAHEAFGEELREADKNLERGDYGQAAASYMEALRTGFSPVLHIEHTHSPLAVDPAGYTSPLRSSRVAAIVCGVEPPRSKDPVRPHASERPRRIVFATHSDDSFLRPIVDHFDGIAGIEVRVESFAGSPALERYGKRQTPFVEQILTSGSDLTEAMEESFRAALQWADVVFVEWSTALAALLSHLDRGDTQIVARMHSWEAWSFWPHLTNYGNLDDLVFVSEPMRDFALCALPGLALSPPARTHVVPNAMHLGQYALPKDDDARFTLAVVGASRVVKDPLWAVEVVRRLRESDDRYRLRLIRGHMEDRGPASRRYADRLAREVQGLPPGTVEITEHTDELARELQSVGVVLSSSVRESFHIGLVEAVASGALPVVRDWPYLPGAAASIFGQEWVVETPADAADRIMAHTQDVEVWRTTTRAAAELVVATWDWAAVKDSYEQLLLG